MATDPELLKADAILKEKYLDIVGNLSVKELKKFKKNEYQKLVLIEFMELLPHYDKAQLNETALYVSNALNNAVIKLLPKKLRESSGNKRKSSALISESVLDDLDTTMLPPSQEHTDGRRNENENEQSDNDDENIDTRNDGQSRALDDSITLLKQPATTTKDNSTDRDSKDKPSSKCCDTCTIKPKPRKSYPMTRCSLCMSWYHDQCVGLEKDEPIGVWLCVSCRQVPDSIQDSLIDIKTEVEDLKESTKSIFTLLNTLSTEVGKNIQGINDKLTALSKQITCNDKKLSETLSSMNATTDNLKTSLDQKTCQLLNKTTTIIDKLKTQGETLNQTSTYHSAGPAQDKNSNANQNSTITSQHADRSDNETQNKKQPGNNKSQNKQNKITSHPTEPSAQRSPSVVDTETIIDLTSSTPKKEITQPTLLVGSSILKGVKVSELNKNTAVRTFPGATIGKLQNRLKQFDISKCETVIIHVGGNDADEGVDLDNFRDQYSSLLDDVASDNRRIIVSGLLPRDSVDLDQYNTCLKNLCETRNVDFVDHYNGFLLASGDIVDSYYHKDKLHPNAFGTRKLLKNLDIVKRVTNFNTRPQPTGPARRNGSSIGGAGFRPKVRGPHVGQYRKGQYNESSHNGSNNHGQKYCHICSMRGHRTQDCWFNRRNTGTNRYQAY